jgi:hypothetical protein
MVNTDRFDVLAAHYLLHIQLGCDDLAGKRGHHRPYPGLNDASMVAASGLTLFSIPPVLQLHVVLRLRRLVRVNKPSNPISTARMSTRMHKLLGLVRVSVAQDQQLVAR